MSALEDLRIEAEEDGWHLVLTFDGVLSEWIEAVTGDGRLKLRMPNDVAEQLIKETAAVRDYFAGRDEARAEYDAGAAETYDDPAEHLRVAADHHRKADREGGIG